MIWIQKEIKIQQKQRGFHLITNEVLQQIPELRKVKIGMMNIFIKHTSASLTLNENADPDVRKDFETYFNKSVPESFSGFIHTSEGSDDMPAHIKSSVLGNNLNIPITNGNLNLGTWQGIYLCEHRNYGGSRKLVITIFGQELE